MANTGFKGLDVRQTGNELVFRAFLQTSAGALVTSGTTNFYLMELQSDGTIKTYDFNDNTFKTTACTTENLAGTYRKSNNATTDTGLWTATLSTLTGFTVGAIYLVRVNNSGASPTDQIREFQYGGDQGDLVVTAGATGVGYLQADELRVNGDSTAPGNIALTFNGTGYVAPTAPAQQQQVANIAVTGAALNQTAASRTLTTGTETNAYTDTFTDNQVYHTITSAGGTIDIYYEFTLGSTGQAGTGMFWNGYVGGTVNSIKVYAYNWGNATFDQIGTILGITGTTESSVELDLTNSHTGTGGNLGKVRIRFQNTGLTAATLNTDFLLVGYTTILTAAQIATGVWQDTTSSDFTVSGSIGKSLFTSGNAPGAASGLAIVGSAMTLANGSIVTATFGTCDLTSTMKTSVQTACDAAITANTTIVEIESETDGIAALPSATTIATAVWEDLLAGGDFGTAGSVGVLFSSLGVKANVVNWLGTAPLGLLNQYVQCDVERWNGTVVHSNPPDTIFIRYNTAQAGGASTITLDSGASATDNLYKNTIIQITGGTGAGQSAIIASYVGATKVATIVGTWAVNPDATSTFNILPFGSVTATVSGGVNVLQWNSVNVTGMPMPTYTQPTGFLAEDFGELDTDIEAIQTAVAALGSPMQAGSQVDLVNAPNATALNAAADALLDRSAAIETGITPRLALRYIAAACCGVITDAGGTTEIFAGVNVASARITATVDAAGDRTVVTLS